MKTEFNISDLLNIDRIKSGEFRDVVPELYNLNTVLENNPWHNSESVFDHTLKVCTSLFNIVGGLSAQQKTYLDGKIDRLNKREILSLAVVFHDLGKKETLINEGNFARCPGHEAAAENIVRDIIVRLMLSSKDGDRLLRIVLNHGLIHKIIDRDDSKYNISIERMAIDHTDIYFDLILLGYADTKTSYLATTNPEEYKLRIDRYKNLINNFII